MWMEKVDAKRATSKTVVSHVDVVHETTTRHGTATFTVPAEGPGLGYFRFSLTIPQIKELLRQAELGQQSRIIAERCRGR